MKRLIKASSEIEQQMVDAVYSNNAQTVKELIAQGVSVDCKEINGTPVLVMASARRCPEIVRLLLENGADVDITDKQGYTALQYAARLKNSDVVKILKEYHATDFGFMKPRRIKR